MSVGGSHYADEGVDTPEEIRHCLEECRFPECRNCIPQRRLRQPGARKTKRLPGGAKKLDPNRLVEDWNAGATEKAMAKNQGVSGPVMSRTLSRLGLAVQGKRDKITVDFLLQSEQAYRFKEDT